ncbi:MAG: hypothetical protein IJ841_03610 [Prevotella sp.]|nr:hypothetical protein [Prevotella sp.]
MKSEAIAYADALQEGGNRASQNYSTYVSERLYEEGFTTCLGKYQTKIDNLLTTIRQEENAARRSTAMTGYDDLWNQLKKVGDEDGAVTENGSLVNAVSEVDENAYGRSDLESQLESLRTRVTGLKEQVDSKDEAFKENREVQDYSQINFTNISTTDLSNKITKVSNNYAAYFADLQAYTTAAAEAQIQIDAVEDLVAGTDVSAADKTALKGKAQEITSKLGTYNTELTTNNESYEYVEENAELHTVELSAITALVEQLKTAIEAAEEAFSAAEGEAQTIIDAANDEVASAKAALASSLVNDSELGDYTKLKQKADAEIQAIEIDDYQNAINAINQARETGTLTQNKEQLTEDLNDQVEAIVAIKNSYIEKCDQNKAAYTAAKKLIVANNQSAEAYLQSAIGTKSNINENGYTETINSINQQISTLTDRIESDNENFVNAESLEAATVVGDYALELAAIKTAIDNLASTIASDNRAAQDAQAKAEADEAAKTAVESKVEDLRAAVEEAVEVVEGYKIDALEYEAGSYFSTDEITAQIEALTTAVNDAEHASDYTNSQEYTAAVTKIETAIDTYKSNAETAYSKVQAAYDQYTTLEDKFDHITIPENVKEDFQSDVAAIGESVNGVLTTINEVKRYNGTEHLQAAESLDVTETVSSILEDIDDLVSSAQITSEQRTAKENREKAQREVLGKLNLAKEKMSQAATAKGDDAEQGNDTNGSLEAYNRWNALLTELEATFNSASTFSDKKATAIYEEIISKEGEDNDLTELIDTLGDGEKSGLIVDLAKQKANVAANNEYKGIAYAAIGLNDNGEEDATIGNSLVKAISDATTAAKAKVADLPAADKAAGEALIDQAIGAIEEQKDALKQAAITAYQNETLKSAWEAGNTQTDALKDTNASLISAVSGIEAKAETWAKDVVAYNSLAEKKATALNAIETSINGMDVLAGAAAGVFTAELNRLKDWVDVDLPAVKGEIITDNEPLYYTEDCVADLEANFNTAQIKKIEDQAQANKAANNELYAKWSQLSSDLDEAIETYGAKEDVQGKENLLTKLNEERDSLDKAKDTIDDHFKAGEYKDYTPGTAAGKYKVDADALSNIEEAINQIKRGFDAEYDTAISTANGSAVSALQEKVGNLLTAVQAANATATAYEKLAEKYSDITDKIQTLRDALPSTEDILTLNSDVSTHGAAATEAGKLYQERYDVYDADAQSIETKQTAVTNAEQTFLSESNAIVTAAWDEIRATTTDDVHTDNVATIDRFDDNAEASEKMTAAGTLLSNGDGKKQAIEAAVDAYNAAETRADKQEKINAVVAAAGELDTAVSAYNDATTGYAALVKDAQNIAAKADITAKVNKFGETVSADEAKVNGTYTTDVELTEERKDALKDAFATQKAKFTAVQTEVADTENAYEDYNNLKAKLDALNDSGNENYYTLQALDYLVDQWKEADALNENIRTAIATYVDVTDGKLDKGSTKQLNAVYTDAVTEISGSLVENDLTVTQALGALEGVIIAFTNAAQYESVDDVDAAAEAINSNTAIEAARRAEKDALAPMVTKLREQFNFWSQNASVTIDKITEKQTEVNNIEDACNSDNTAFSVLKGYEKRIEELLSEMDVDGEGAALLAQFQTEANALGIDDTTIAFFAYEFGTDTHATTVKQVQTDNRAAYDNLNGAISDLKAALGTTYTESNILFKKSEVEGLFSSIDTQKSALNSTLNSTDNELGMSPIAAMNDYYARKMANASAASTLDPKVQEVQNAYTTAQSEASIDLSGVNMTAINSYDADKANLDLVEKSSDKYVAKNYNTDALLTQIAAAVQLARKAQITALITELKLNSIVAQVSDALDAAGVTGDARTTPTSLGNDYAAEFTTLKATIDADTELAAGEYNTQLNEIADEVSSLISDIQAGNYTIVVGDITGTGKVQSGDFDLLRDIILGIKTPADEKQEAACDINGDGEISIGDLVQLNNILLGLNPNGTARNARALFAGGENVTTELTQTSATTRRIAVCLKNTTDYVAFQMDVVLPEGMTLVGESLTDRASTQRLASANLADGTHRIISVPLLNKTFKGNEGAVLYLDVETDQSYSGGDIELQNVIFSDVMGNDNQFKVDAGTVTAIKDALNAAGEYVMDKVYDLGGKLKNGLKKGINIIRKADGSTQKVVK